MTLTPFIKLHGNAKDLTGFPFGRLTVLGPVRKTKHSQIVWLCKCECCNFATVVGGSLRSGATKSCGCLHRETARQNHTSHGLRNTLEYGAWARIKSRCYNPRHKSFNRHGGRESRWPPNGVTIFSYSSIILGLGLRQSTTSTASITTKAMSPATCDGLRMSSLDRDTSVSFRRSTCRTRSRRTPAI